jgi:hypothetical protein
MMCDSNERHRQNRQKNETVERKIDNYLRGMNETDDHV